MALLQLYPLVLVAQYSSSLKKNTWLVHFLLLRLVMEFTRNMIENISFGSF